MLSKCSGRIMQTKFKNKANLRLPYLFAIPLCQHNSMFNAIELAFAGCSLTLTEINSIDLGK